MSYGVCIMNHDRRPLQFTGNNKFPQNKCDKDDPI